MCPVIVLTPCRLGKEYAQLYDARGHVSAVKIQSGYVQGDDLGAGLCEILPVQTKIGALEDVRVVSPPLFSAKSILKEVAALRKAREDRAAMPPPPAPNRSSSRTPSTATLDETPPDIDHKSYKRPISHRFVNDVVPYGNGYPVLCWCDFKNSKIGVECNYTQVATFSIEEVTGYYTPLRPKGVDKRGVNETSFLGIKVSFEGREQEIIWRVGAYSTISEMNEMLRASSPYLSVFDLPAGRCAMLEVALLEMRPKGGPQHVPTVWGENQSWLIYENDYSIDTDALKVSPQFVFQTEDTDIRVPEAFKQGNGPLATLQRPPTCGCPMMSVVDSVIITHALTSCLRSMLG